MAKKDCKAGGGAIKKSRGGSLTFDAGAAKARSKSFVKQGGSGKSVFSSAGGGSASTNPMGCTAGRK